MRPEEVPASALSFLRDVLEHEGEKTDSDGFCFRLSLDAATVLHRLDYIGFRLVATMSLGSECLFTLRHDQVPQ